MYDLFARYYDLLHSSLIRDRDFILELAARTEGHILELGCGTGRLLIPLARAGHPVTGVDNSPQMLFRADERLKSEPFLVQQRVELVAADMTTLPLANKTYSLVLLPYNTLFHFPHQEASQLLRRAQDHSQPKGQLFIDVSNPFLIAQYEDDAEPSFEKEFEDQESGAAVSQWSQSKLDISAQCLHTTWIFKIRTGLEQPSEQQMMEFDYWYHYPHQIEMFLRQSGYQLIELLGDYDRSPFTEDSDRLLILARKA